MWIYGVSGFITGFILGMAANLYLLRDTPRENLRTDKKLQKRFGALNWGMAFLGMAIALVIARH
jgi:hypothetical protein